MTLKSLKTPVAPLNTGTLRNNTCSPCLYLNVEQVLKESVCVEIACKSGEGKPFWGHTDFNRLGDGPGQDPKHTKNMNEKRNNDILLKIWHFFL